MNVSVTPIFPLRGHNPEERGSFHPLKSVDSKVRGLVLERISHAKGGLLPSTTAPHVVIDFLPAFESVRLEHAPPKRKNHIRKIPRLRKAPLGLSPVDPEGWLNALMQFVLFIPGFPELFFFAPRSFYPFREFMDQYHQDQEENRTFSSANGAALFRYLVLKLPSLSLHEIFQFLVRVLHPKWEIYKKVEEAFASGFPTDLFVTESSLKRQFFTEPDLFCYDLNAFIELRPDGAAANFIAYVKVEEGIWYQCEDDRITQLRSTNLPLHRAVLLHYRRMTFGKNGLALY